MKTVNVPGKKKINPQALKALRAAHAEFEVASAKIKAVLEDVLNAPGLELIFEFTNDPKKLKKKAKGQKAAASKSYAAGQSTKSQSHASFLSSGRVKPTEQKILKCLQQAGSPLSRAEIAKATGLRLSTVCGRVTPLLNSGRLVVEGHTIDTSSNREVECLWLGK